VWHGGGEKEKMEHVPFSFDAACSFAQDKRNCIVRFVTIVGLSFRQRPNAMADGEALP
jgi:hypothetical protein